ncbi:Nrap protein [Bimuria novae-zelandiae CBS 107.79]|uniref:U3 small nucleolar RNA-associated protein 22 n=1 Tax=Bimuria novae-zelandiae CBS 107.79 TaxID=1447943 RepID=A0A6A5USK9_9PLEO|nr:Nrap protein [Bimuria novae-zelandiae CBS 107.79]
MAPAIKRRKLKHDDAESDSETNLVEDHADGAFSTDGDGHDIDDVSMDDLDDANEDEASDEDSLEGDADDGKVESIAPATKPVKGAAPSRDGEKSKPHRQPDPQLQGGVYTAETFKSNFFKLQVDELLAQVKIKYGKKEAPAENAMRTLKAIIEQLPSREPELLVDAQKTLRASGVTIPFPNPPPPTDAKYKFQYERPASINATGSYPLKTATRTDGELSIDLVVTMPKAIFQDKDYLNNRYFYKRAFYLACLAAGIRNSKEHSFKLSFDSLNGNQLQPILVVRPSGNGDSDDFSNSKCCINILLAVSEGVFPNTKLLPRANCVRPKGEDMETESTALTPTPFYNSSLRSDATVTPYLKLLHSTAANCDAFKDACVLGRIWLKQRGFRSAIRGGGFGNFEWATLMALLMQPNRGAGAPPLSSGYSSYQMFKATLQFLALHDLSKKAFVFLARDIASPKNGLAPMLFDGPRGLNILFKMTPWSYGQLQLEAKITIETLGDGLFDQFDSTFILRTDLKRYRYDAILEVPLSALGLDLNREDVEERTEEACQKIYNVLTRALTDRVTAIDLSLPGRRSWSISGSRPNDNTHASLVVKIATDPANANRTVDHGPSAENKQEAAFFRKFWGDKSELRRFRDGSILETVVWSTKDPSSSVLEQIVLYILSKHIDVRIRDDASFTYDSCAHIVSSGRLQGQSGTSAFAPIMSAFAQVEKDIRELEDLPLSVRHIRAADAQLRYSSVDTRQTSPASIILQFEASARWPDDLCAIQRTKIAFLLKLSELLSAAHKIYKTEVGLENPSQPSQNQTFLDITVRSGTPTVRTFVFRLRIHHDREATLLERQLKDKTLDAQSRESAAVALALYNRDFLRVLSHTQTIQNLCTRYPALSPAVRLTKRWFDSHLLSPHIAPELIELLVVRTFLQPHPWPVPSCATTGFLRTLAWISRWDWRHSPLIVDFSSTASNTSAESGAAGNGRMKTEDVEKIQTRFEAWRRIDPAMNRVVLFAATNSDTDGNTWTDRGRPEKVVAARMTALAKAATQVVRTSEDVSATDSKSQFAAETLFVPQLQDFDFVVHMSPKYCKSSKKKRSEDIKFKNIEVQQAVDSAKNNPTQLARLFAEDLRSVYGDAILWFWDEETITSVAGLWNPGVTAQRTFKVKPEWNSVPVKGKAGEKKDEQGKGKEGTDVDIRVNKEAVYNEIKRLGGEMVSKIEVNR